MKKMLLFSLLFACVLNVFSQDEKQNSAVRIESSKERVLRVDNDRYFKTNLIRQEDVKNDSVKIQKDAKVFNLPEVITIVQKNKKFFASGQPKVGLPYSTDFTNVNEWWVYSPNNTYIWEVGVQYAPNYGPASGHSGQICAGTKLNNKYVNNAESWLGTPQFSLSGCQNPRVRFWMDMECEDNYDYGAFYISKNGGNFYLISYTDFEQNRPNSSNKWTGNMPTGDWQEVVLDLFSVTNPNLAPITSSDNIEIAFIFYSDNTVVGPGWYIDDFEIYDLKDTTTYVHAPLSQVSGGDISSLVASESDAVDVFKFRITDPGTADGLPTKITQFTIWKNGGTADWVRNIAGAKLITSDGIELTDFVASIYSDKIVLKAKPGKFYSLPNGQTKEFTLKIWLKDNNLQDNATLQFRIPNYLHEFVNVHDGTSSEFRIVFPSGVNSNTFTIRVVATQLSFIVQPSNIASTGVALSQQPIVAATDANGNIDVDATGTVTLTNTENLNMSNNTATLASGVATFSNFMFTSGGTYVQLNASTGTLSNDKPSIEIAVDVNLCTIFAENFDSYPTGPLPTNPNNWQEKVLVSSTNIWVIGQRWGGNNVLTIGKPDPFQYANDDAIKIAYYKQKINGRGYKDIKITLTWQSNGEVVSDYYDFGKIVWSADNGDYGYANNIAFYNQNGWITATYDLSTVDNREFYIGFFWKNDDIVINNPPFGIDNFTIKGRPALDYNFTYRKDLYRPIVGTIFEKESWRTKAILELPADFNFVYDGEQIDQLLVCWKGWVMLNGTNVDLGDISNTLKNTSYTKILAPLWDDDLSYDNESKIIYKIESQAPSRVFVLEWYNFIWGGKRVNFQLRLYETSNIIEFWYGNFNPNPSGSATIGINAVGNCGFNRFLSITPAKTPLHSYIVENANIGSQSQYITKGLVYMFNRLEMQNFVTWQEASLVIGQPDFKTINTTASQTIAAGASSSAISSKGVLAVGSMYANRVLLWNSLPETNGAPASVVIGQTDFTSTTPGCSPTKLYNPTNVAFSPDGTKLIVCDGGNNRVLIWNSIPTTNGAPADVVIGQEDFYSNSPGCTPSKLDRPTGALCLPDGRLLISDYNNGRVLIFNKIPETNGASADVVIGQPDFYSDYIHYGPDGLSYPWDCALSPDGRLLISDDGDQSGGAHRVLIFQDVPTTNGAAADNVIGNTVFGSIPAGFSRTRFDQPSITVSIEGKLAIADFGNNRVMMYNNIPAYNGAPADHVLGQAHYWTKQAFNKGLDNGGNPSFANARNMYSPYSINFDINGRLYVNGTTREGYGMHRVLVFGQAPTTSTDIAVSISTQTPQLCVYNKAKYDVIVRNNGPSEVYNLYVNAVLPFGMSPVDYEAHDGTIYNLKTGYWYIPYLAVGQEAHLSFTGLVLPSLKNSTVTAYAFTMGMSAKELNYSNNAASAVVAIRDYFAPLISEIEDVAIARNQNIVIPFTVSDNDGLGDIVSYTGSSSNVSLIPNSNIVFGGIAPNKTVTLTPLTNKYGYSDITILVTDSHGCYNDEKFTIAVGNIWEGDHPTDPTNWHVAENWSVKIPTSTDEAIIPTYPKGGVFPHIYGTTAYCYDLYIEPRASVTIDRVAGDPYGDIDLFITNNLIIKSDETGTGAFVDREDTKSSSIGNTVIIERYLKPGKWSYISSPVNACPNTVFTQNNCNGYYNPNLIYFNEAYNSDTDGDGDIDWFDGWVWPWYNNQNNDPLVVTRGYAYYYGEGDCGNVFTITGNHLDVNSANINFTVTNQNPLQMLDTVPVPARGWNLIGNPYPSGVNLDDFIHWNRSVYGNDVLDATVYFWDEPGSSGWYLDGRDYASYNRYTGGTVGSGKGSVIPDKYLSIGQGFFVHTNRQGSSNLVFLNYMRRTENSYFFKNSSNDDTVRYIPRVKFSLFNEKYYNEIIVGFAEDADSVELNNKYDGYKIEGNINFSFYAIKNNKNFVNIAVNPINEFVNRFLPLGFKTTVVGEHTLKLKLLDRIPQNTNVYLFDTYADTVVNLRLCKYYKFNVNAAGRYNDRFKILFTFNSLPYLANPIPDYVIYEGSQSVIDFDRNTFRDNDTYDSLRYSLTLANGQPLPSWMFFDANELRLYLMPEDNAIGIHNLKLTATDLYNASESAIFKITVLNVNDTPFVANYIDTIVVPSGNILEFTIPDNLFCDPDVGDALTISADITGLDWVSFNNNTKTLIFSPTNNNIGIWQIPIIATDIHGASATYLLKVKVVEAAGLLNLSDKYFVYPNPTNGVFSVVTPWDSYQLEIYNSNGIKVYQTIATQNIFKVDSRIFAPGMYVVKVLKDKEQYQLPLVVY